MGFLFCWVVQNH